MARKPKLTLERVQLTPELMKQVKWKIRSDLTPAEAERVRLLWERVKDYLPSSVANSLEDWERGFMCDLHPSREIAVWERMATVIERAHAELGFDHHETLRVIMPWTGGDIAAMDKINHKKLLAFFLAVFI